MTMKELKKAFNQKADQFDAITGTDLGDWMRWMWEQFESLYTEGIIKYYNNDFLKAANTFHCHGGDITITHCLDLHSITATKANTRKFAEWFLNN